jgi:hypothetical protein
MRSTVVRSLFRSASQERRDMARQSQIICSPKWVGCGERFSGNGRLFSLLRQADDDFDPPPFEVFQRVFDHRSFRSAPRQLRISEADEPLPWLGLNGFRFKQIWNRQQLMQVQRSLPERRLCAPHLIRIRTMEVGDMQEPGSPAAAARRGFAPSFIKGLRTDGQAANR